MERPITEPLQKLLRPFTGKEIEKIQPKKVLQSAALQSIPEDDLRRKLYSSCPPDQREHSQTL